RLRRRVPAYHRRRHREVRRHRQGREPDLRAVTLPGARCYPRRRRLLHPAFVWGGFQAKRRIPMGGVPPSARIVGKEGGYPWLSFDDVEVCAVDRQIEADFGILREKMSHEGRSNEVGSAPAILAMTAGVVQARMRSGVALKIWSEAAGGALTSDIVVSSCAVERLRFRGFRRHHCA